MSKDIMVSVEMTEDEADAFDAIRRAVYADDEEETTAAVRQLFEAIEARGFMRPGEVS